MVIKDLLVRDAMTQKPVTLHPDETVLKASQLMVEKNVGGVLAIENESVKGVITKTDILDKVILKNKDPSQVKVRDVMVRNYVSVSPTTRINEAAKIMVKYNIRRLPVLKNGTLQGLITQTDLMKIQPEIIELLIDKFRQSDNGFDIRNLSTVKGVCDVCGVFENLKTTEIGFICKQCESAI